MYTYILNFLEIYLLTHLIEWKLKIQFIPILLRTSLAAMEEVIKTYFSQFTVDNLAHKVSVSFQRLPSCYNVNRLLIQLKVYKQHRPDDSAVIGRIIDSNQYNVSISD